MLGAPLQVPVRPFFADEPTLSHPHELWQGSSSSRRLDLGRNARRSQRRLSALVPLHHCQDPAAGRFAPARAPARALARARVHLQPLEAAEDALAQRRGERAQRILRRLVLGQEQLLQARQTSAPRALDE
eukprot:2815274-Pleurochrysis_carterae.AAC.2